MEVDDTRIQELVAREMIRDLVYRYSLYADTNQPDCLADLFTDDCHVDVGREANSAVEGRDALRAFQRAVMNLPAGEAGNYPLYTSHHNSNVFIEFESTDLAKVRTSCYSWHEMSDGTHPEVWGYYDDVMRKTHAGWRIARRVLHVYGDSGVGSGHWHRGDRRTAV